MINGKNIKKTLNFHRFVIVRHAQSNVSHQLDYTRQNSDSSKDIILVAVNPRDSAILISQLQLEACGGNFEPTGIKEATSYRKNKPPLITS